MHEEVFPEIKAAMELRARFMPLLYTLAHRGHATGGPMIVPTLYHFDDVACREDADTFMLGENVLVAPVVVEGAADVSVYLPDVAGGWFDLRSGENHTGGQTVCVSAPLEDLPIFVRAGSVLPLADGWTQNKPHDASGITMRCYPVRGVERSSDFFTDEGDGFAYREGGACHWSHMLTCDGAAATVQRTALMEGAPTVPIRYESADPSIILKAPL